MCHKICDKGKCYIFFFYASVIFCNFKKFLIAITGYYFCIFDVKVIAKKKNHHKLNGYTISFESTCTYLYVLFCYNQ